MESLQALNKALDRAEKQLEKVRGVEYLLPFGSMRRAKVSRKWDILAREKDEILTKLYSHPEYEEGMRLAENKL